MYWLNYHEQGTGIVPKALNLGLSRGILAHAMLAGIMEYVRDNDQLPPSSHVRSVIKEQKALFLEEAMNRGLEQVDQGMLLTEAERQAAIVEGLVLAWVRIRLPFIHQRFKVVKVEDDFDVTLDEQGEMILMSKADGVLQDRETQDYSPLEFKTTGTDREDYFEAWRYDVQTLNHLMAIQQEFGKPGTSVMMEFLYIGYKKLDKMSGQTTYYSPIVRGYVKRGLPPLEQDEFAWGSEYSRRRGWEAFDVWREDFPQKPREMPTMEFWVNHTLDVATAQASLFTREIFRNEAEMREWLMGATHQQKRIMQGVQLMAALDRGETALGFDRDYVMNSFFPARLDRACRVNQYYRSCPYMGICFGLVTGDPLKSGFVPREAHHESEFEVE